MKKSLIPVLVLGVAMSLFAGCSWQVGGGKTSQVQEPTIGQQLIDLQKARASGAINQQEFDAERQRILQEKN